MFTPVSLWRGWWAVPARGDDTGPYGSEGPRPRTKGRVQGGYFGGNALNIVFVFCPMFNLLPDSVIAFSV